MTLAILYDSTDDQNDIRGPQAMAPSCVKRVQWVFLAEMSHVM